MQIEKSKSKQPIPEHARCVFKGVFFDVYQWEQEMFDDSTTVFEKLKRPDTVVVFPVLPNGQILLVEDSQPGKNMQIVAPGGRIEEGEDVLTAAKRELLEETGYEAEEFILWESSQPISKIEWCIYVFIAKSLRKVAEPSLDPGEKITPKIVTLEELIEMSFDGRYTSGEGLLHFLKAKIDPVKMEEIKQLFSPK